MTPAASAGVGLSGGAGASGVHPSAMANVSASLSAALIAASTSSRGGVVSQPLLLVRDGFTSEVSDGQVIPIPQNTVSTQGTVTTSGVTNVQVGTVFLVGLREVGESAANLSFTVTQSSIASYVDNIYPLQNQSQIKGDAVVRSGGVYYLGGMTKSGDQRSQGQIRSGERVELSDLYLQLWCRVYQVVGQGEGRRGVLPGGLPPGGLVTGFGDVSSATSSSADEAVPVEVPPVVVEGGEEVAPERVQWTHKGGG